MILPIYFIVGPTAIGKSSLAIKVAKKLNGQIINVDSMQVYENLNILTSRPNEKEMTEVKHHLYGHIKGSERYNVARWCEEASVIIKNYSKRDFIFSQESISRFSETNFLFGRAGMEIVVCIIIVFQQLLFF